LTLRRKASNAINRGFTQMGTDSFSARMAETRPKGMRTIICVNRRESAVNSYEQSNGKNLTLGIIIDG